MEIKNGITIYKEEISNASLESIRNDLVILNPKYEEAQARGRRPVYKVKGEYRPIPKYLYFMRETETYIQVPLAYLRRLEGLFKSNLPKPKIVNDTTITLRDYQREAITSILQGNFGIISSPAASGKTIMGIAIVQHLNLKTLWIAHRGDLVTQANKTFEKYSKESAGFIGEGKYSIGNVFTGAIVNSVENNITTIAEENFELIIVDEVHRAPTNRMFNALIGLSPKITYGLSATPFREDGLTTILYHMLGPIVTEIKRNLLVELGYIVTPTIYMVNTQLDSLLQPSMEYHEYIYGLINDFDRNAIILEHVVTRVLEGDISLVLCDRVAHAEFFYGVLKNLGLKAAIIHGKNKKIKKKLHTKVSTHQISVIVTTYKYFSDGMDLPELQTLFFADPFRSMITCEQTVGRVQRICENKPEAKVIDFVDDNAIAVKQAKARIAIYEKLGCSIKTMSHQSILSL